MVSKQGRAMMPTMVVTLMIVGMLAGASDARDIKVYGKDFLCLPYFASIRTCVCGLQSNRSKWYCAN
jgi:hypothetical protein